MYSTIKITLTIYTVLLVQNVVVDAISISFTPNSTITIHVDESVTVEYDITNVNETGGGAFLIYSEDKYIADLEVILENPQENFKGKLNISGIFLGRTKIICKNLETNTLADGSLNIIVIRKQRVIDTIFTVSVAIFASIIYINFGCTINWSELPQILKRPIGPCIGFCGQFVVMPLLSYGIGQILFPDNPEMQLGVFFVGVAPAGGASNIWTVLLEGNIDLSIIMTTISTIAALGMMPLWIFTLGRIIFESGNLQVPYTQISTYVVALVIPLGIGFLIERYFKRFAEFMKKILKGFSVCLVIFIVSFAIATNLYLFQLFSWQIIVAGIALPLLGYTFGFIAGKIFRQPSPDCLTMAVEVGIQNTGISIFLLRFALPQPQADLTTVIPVSVSMLTPFPLIFLYICLKVKSRFSRNKKDDEIESTQFTRIQY